MTASFALFALRTSFIFSLVLRVNWSGDHREGIQYKHYIHRFDRYSDSNIDGDRLLEINELNDLWNDIDRSLMNQRDKSDSYIPSLKMEGLSHNSYVKRSHFDVVSSARAPAAADNTATNEDLSDDNYSEKEQSTALLLAIFMGWCGAARFYLGYNAMGISQLLMFTIPIMVAVLDKFVWKFDNDIPRKLCVSFLASIVMYGWLVWWIVDIVTFASDKVYDVDGNTLVPL